MTFDARLPLSLKKEQLWFGSIISRPIDIHNCMQKKSPSNRPMKVEAAEHIVASPTMQPAERIQIYNQQYWWRLFNAMQDTYALLVRTVGYEYFNQKIALPYLIKYPPNHWSLGVLGERLWCWFEEDYQANDRVLLKDICALDWGFNASFLAGDYPSLTAEQLPNEDNMEEFVQRTIYLQPHIQLFAFKGDLFAYRDEMMKYDPNYWLQHKHPEIPLGKPYWFVLYRNAQHEISWKEISLAEYHLLSLFRYGTTIEFAFEWFEKQDAALCAEAIQNLSKWFEQWTSRGWLSLK